MFDTPTLIAIVFLNAFAMAIALTVASHSMKSPGTMAWIGGAWMQALGWGCLIIGYKANVFWLLSCGAVALSTSVSLAHHSVRTFVGKAGSTAWLYIAPLCIAIFHPLAYLTDHPHLRIGVVAMATVIQCLAIVLTVLRSSRSATRGWRWLVVFTMGSAGSLALLKLFGLMLSANPTLQSSDLINTIGLALATISVNLNSLALLVAQRLDAQRKLEVLATTDALTGLVNRRSLIEFGERRFKQALESDSQLTVVMIDLDFFKAINDTHGHLVGDKVLVEFAASLQLNVRAPDLVGRFGGEEFCVIMPNSGFEAAASLDKRLRDSFAQVGFDSPGLQPTYSAGAAQVNHMDKSFGGVLGRADLLLYKAKQSGRNRIVMTDAESNLPVSAATCEQPPRLSRYASEGSDRANDSPSSRQVPVSTQP
ncbi:MAG: GGDEF domain-containing protein [Burkholderiaceae bacterium]|nr:GGDEF domain-containing protein [Burkholderiaceae bacterium]